MKAEWESRDWGAGTQPEERRPQLSPAECSIVDAIRQGRRVTIHEGALYHAPDGTEYPEAVEFERPESTAIVPNSSDPTFREAVATLASIGISKHSLERVGMMLDEVPASYAYNTALIALLEAFAARCGPTHPRPHGHEDADPEYRVGLIYRDGYRQGCADGQQIARINAGFNSEDVALCDLMLNVERSFGPSVGNWLTESDRQDLASLRDKIAATLPPAPTSPSVVGEPSGRASMADQIAFVERSGKSSRLGTPLRAARLTVTDYSSNQPGEGNTGPDSTIYNPGYQRYLDATTDSPKLEYQAWLDAGQPLGAAW